MIRVRQVKVGLRKEEEEILTQIGLKLHIPVSKIVSFQIHKQSIDARRKNDLHLSLEIDVEVEEEEKIIQKNNSIDVVQIKEERYVFPMGGEQSFVHRPVIVGAGPAGLFAAYLLSENGYKPIVIERGEKVENRMQTVEKFWKEGILNPKSNVQFGEGGAGTFSDGKLNTLVKDKAHRAEKVLEIFVQNGAPKEILYESKPHIGTDLLRNIIIHMREEMIKRGVVFQYNTQLTDLFIKEGKLEAIEINHCEKILCESLILAIGHSARDTFEMLYHKKVTMEPKPFAIGIRLQHPQRMINKAQYGIENHPLLPPASYKLTYTSSMGRGVYSFCMCPGGEVVNASSEKGMLTINGMSEYKRDKENANSAIVVTVNTRDFGEGPLDGMYFQRSLEKKAYVLGKGKIPIQLWKDFEKNQKSEKLGNIKPIFKGEYIFSNLQELFPSYITESLLEAIPYFDRKIKGFAREDAILAGIESRTSSPVRILRSESYMSNIEGIYPCGEGSGYAGGIMTAAMDGIKVAEVLSTLYAPMND